MLGELWTGFEALISETHYVDDQIEDAPKATQRYIKNHLIRDGGLDHDQWRSALQYVGQWPMMSSVLLEFNRCEIDVHFAAEMMLDQLSEEESAELWERVRLFH